MARTRIYTHLQFVLSHMPNGTVVYVHAIDNVYGRGYETFPLRTKFRNLLIVTVSTE